MWFTLMTLVYLSFSCFVLYFSVFSYSIKLLRFRQKFVNEIFPVSLWRETWSDCRVTNWKNVCAHLSLKKRQHNLHFYFFMLSYIRNYMNNSALNKKKLFLLFASLCLFHVFSIMLFIVKNRRFVHEGNMMLDFLPSFFLLFFFHHLRQRGMWKHPLVFG